MIKIVFGFCLLPSIIFCCLVKEKIEFKLGLCTNLKQYVMEFEPEEVFYIAYLEGKEQAYKECLIIVSENEKAYDNLISTENN